jgi:hypothetical protein
MGVGSQVLAAALMHSTILRICPRSSLFEKNLTKATTNTPCADFGFTDYLQTDTHGFGPIKMTLDMYTFPATAKACDEQCKETCCRNGGGDACTSACGCTPCGTKTCTTDEYCCPDAKVRKRVSARVHCNRASFAPRPVPTSPLDALG